MLRRNISFLKTVASMPQVPAYAHISNNEDINYLCNVNSNVNFNCKFVRDRKVIIKYLWFYLCDLFVYAILTNNL